MGEENKPSIFCYSINGATGEMKELGKIASTSEVKVGKATGEKNECVGFCNIGASQMGTGELTLEVIPKAIKKKRFIKLLMGIGYQKNEAIKMHDEYMKKYKSRTVIGLVCFEMDYRMGTTIEFKIGGFEDVNCESE